MRVLFFYLVVGLSIFTSAWTAQAQRQTSQDEAADQINSSQYARQLSSRDPSTRQSAAEALARLAAVDQKKLVEGYVLEEKDKRVKLALNWALYRMGKSEVLFAMVRDLDSSRHDQAVEYLTQLESPAPLYLFLRQENITPKVVARLLEVLGQIGDAESLEQIRPFVDSYDPRISEAAQSSTNLIQHRLDQPQPATKTRPRVIEQKPDR